MLQDILRETNRILLLHQKFETAMTAKISSVL